MQRVVRLDGPGELLCDGAVAAKRRVGVLAQREEAHEALALVADEHDMPDLLAEALRLGGLEDGVLDGHRRHVLAAVRDEQLLLAAGDEEPAILVHAAHVARVQQTGGIHHLGARVLVLEVARHDVAPAAADLAVVGNDNLAAGQRAAAAAHGPRRVVHGAAGHAARGFAHAVDLEQGHVEGAEVALGVLAQRRRPGVEQAAALEAHGLLHLAVDERLAEVVERRERHPHPLAGAVRGAGAVPHGGGPLGDVADGLEHRADAGLGVLLGGGLEHARAHLLVHARHAEEERRLGVHERLLERALEGVLGREDDEAAGVERLVEVDGLRGDVRQRQVADDARLLVQRHHAVGHGHDDAQVGVRADHGLGVARRPARVHERRDVVVAQLADRGRGLADARRDEGGVRHHLAARREAPRGVSDDHGEHLGEVRVQLLLVRRVVHLRVLDDEHAHVRGAQDVRGLVVRVGVVDAAHRPPAEHGAERSVEPL
mmetsp:Transcript_346/g.868  ORF Transcript_346/g.868 Transcript_346/m.868 type:complete len:486 (+) Transcript_346:491-1948(+)